MKKSLSLEQRRTLLQIASSNICTQSPVGYLLSCSRNSC